MGVVQLLFFSVMGLIGAVYVYTGIVARRHAFVAGGIAAALYPFFFSDARLLVLAGAVLLPAPLLAEKLSARFTGRRGKSPDAL